MGDRHQAEPRKAGPGCSYGQFIPAELQRQKITVFRIEVEHLSLVAELTLHHRDPFDRLIIAQALTEGMPVISADGVCSTPMAFSASGEDRRGTPHGYRCAGHDPARPNHGHLDRAALSGGSPAIIETAKAGDGQLWRIGENTYSGGPRPRRDAIAWRWARSIRLISVAVLNCTAVLGCKSSDQNAIRWLGTVDTLPSGQIRVTNPEFPIGEWSVSEEFRIGRSDGIGPDIFGRIDALEVDLNGNLWVIDGHAQELRVFTSEGQYVRTIGRRGAGPGEFTRAVRIDAAPDGNLWVMDPQNQRLTVVDTAGAHLEERPLSYSLLLFPWPGGFDTLGDYYRPIFRIDPEVSIALVRHDSSFTVRDTLDVPQDPVRRAGFEMRGADGGGIAAGIPFQGGLRWRLSPWGTIWVLFTDEYRLIEFGVSGDTLRTITREFTPLPVTESDLEQAHKELEWFTRQGGVVDMSRIPRTKPIARDFFFDQDGSIWVEVEVLHGDPGRKFDIFASDGRFIAVVNLPFPIAAQPNPVFRNDQLFGSTRDELDVPYLVVARINRNGV